jgi:hypothetical protein
MKEDELDNDLDEKDEDKDEEGLEELTDDEDEAVEEEEVEEAQNDVESAKDQDVADQIEALDCQIIHYWHDVVADGKLRVARMCLTEKGLLKHGEWEVHFAEKLAPRGLVLRTVQRWMARVVEADKNAKVAVFNEAKDKEATAKRDAVALAITNRQGLEVPPASAEQPTSTTNTAAPSSAAPPKPEPPTGPKPYTPRKRPGGLFYLPLEMTGDEKTAAERLIASPKWPRVHDKLMEGLRGFFLAGTKKIEGSDQTTADTEISNAPFENHPAA